MHTLLLLPFLSQMQANRSSSKLEEITQVVSFAVRQQCYCPLTSEYIAHERLMCSGDDSILFQGRIISIDSTTSSELLMNLQTWVQRAPTVTIEGKYLHVSSHCSVHLNQLGSTKVNCTDQSSPSSTVAIAVTTLFLAIVIAISMTIFIIAFVFYKRKRASPKLKRYVLFSFHTTSSKHILSSVDSVL